MNSLDWGFYFEELDNEYTFFLRISLFGHYVAFEVRVL